MSHVRTLLSPARTTPVLRDVALAVARISIGIVLLAHGWQKISEYTMAGTVEAFEGMGVPLPAVAAVFTAVVELVGGAALIIGLLTPVAAALNLVSLTGALFLVHLQQGIFVEDGGVELVLALIAGLVLLLALGAGRFGVDALLTRRSRAE